jgi:TPR repeat protein
LLLAAAQGLQLATQNLPLLESELTQQQRAEGQKRASNFVPPEVPPRDFMQDAPVSNPPVDLYAKAVTGDPVSQNELGGAFQAGKLGAAKNPIEAAKWYRKAAAHNHPAAQLNLGVCYERGDGVAKDEVEAYKWYLLAAAQGNEKAKDNAPLLELVLLPDQIAEGKRRAENFKPQERTQP